MKTIQQRLTRLEQVVERADEAELSNMSLPPELAYLVLREAQSRGLLDDEWGGKCLEQKHHPQAFMAWLHSLSSDELRVAREGLERRIAEKEAALEGEDLDTE